MSTQGAQSHLHENKATTGILGIFTKLASWAPRPGHSAKQASESRSDQGRTARKEARVKLQATLDQIMN